MAKAQFYIFAAVLLCTVLFVAAINRIYIQEPSIGLSKLYQNYIEESNILINNAVFEGKDPGMQVKNFTQYYISFAKGKNVNIGIFYLLIYPDNTTVNGNYLGGTAIVTTKYAIQQQIVSGTEKNIKCENNVTVEYNNIIYNFDNEDGENIKFKALVLKR
jgi:hypothetical protein